MNLDLITRVIQSPTDATIEELLDDETTVFWVDWREYDSEIIGMCESIIQTGSLSAEEIDADNEAGFDLFIRYQDRRVQVPLEIGEQDRHITLVTLNETLNPDFEVRYCIDSHGSDTAALIPLPCQVWKELEQQHGDAVAKRFYKLQSTPNIFTDVLPF
jgi:hypothetical protein